MKVQGPIRRIECDCLEFQADEHVPTAWIGGASSAAPLTDGAWVKTTVDSPAFTGDDPVCLMLRGGEQPIHEEWLTHVRTGKRIYALVGPEWGKEPEVIRLTGSIRMLIRRIPEVPASAWCVGEKALLCIGGGFSLRLDSAQAEALRQVFGRLFWHEATEEGWSAEQGVVWRPVPERPFDVPELPSRATVRWEPPDARLKGDPQGALMHLTMGPPPSTAPRRLWFPSGPDHHERLARLVQAGAEVLWTDRGLPEILVAGNTGEVLLPGSQGRLRLRLMPGQASDLDRLLAAEPAWRFHTDVRLGDDKHRSAQFWLPGEKAPRGLEDEQIIEVADLQATALHTMSDMTPDSFPSPCPLALSVRYRWGVLPPRVPRGAEQDPLVGQWRRLDKAWVERIDRVRESLKTAEENRGRIGRSSSRLVSATLGFERTHGGLLTRLAELEQQVPSQVGPSKARELLAQLEGIEGDVRRLRSDLDEAERDARERDDREKQKNEWQKRVHEANESLPKRRAELQAAEARQRSLSENLRSLADTLTPSDSRSSKDRKASQRKLSDELERARKETARLGGEVKALEKAAEEQFNYQPRQDSPRSPAQSGRFVPPTVSPGSATQVPEEGLPEEGTLCRHKGQRYLVIQSWEQLAIGKREASRLSAHLVAPEDA